jgi:hypothetical protein
VFIDPSSTVVWDYEAEPNPRRCLGSILNGLLRNYFSVRKTNSEVVSDHEALEKAGDSNSVRTPEQIVAEHELFETAMQSVLAASTHDGIVRRLVELTRSGIVDASEQLAALSVSQGTLYEARRRFHARLEQARRELES